MSPPAIVFDVIVVGGGLSGLYMGYRLSSQTRFRNWKLLEASDRLGGRLANASPSHPIDMGGAWIWPNHQPRMRHLVSDLGLSTFPQPGDPASSRIEGGAAALIDRLSQLIQENCKANCGQRIELNKPVSVCQKMPDLNSKDGFLVHLTTMSGEQFVARQVVFAAPPKIVSQNIQFSQELSKSKRIAMSKSLTWMAGVTKVALLYPDRFWDAKSLQYFNMFSSGPAFQVYDGTTSDGSLAALTFFAFVPPSDQSAQKSDDVLATQVSLQIAQFWRQIDKPELSKLAQAFSKYYVYRWPAMPFISDTEKPVQVNPHPEPVPILSQPEWDGLLLFAGTETDLQSPGVMEGALGAAERALESLFDMEETQTGEA